MWITFSVLSCSSRVKFFPARFRPAEPSACYAKNNRETTNRPYRQARTETISQNSASPTIFAAAGGGESLDCDLGALLLSFADGQLLRPDADVAEEVPVASAPSASRRRTVLG